MVKIAFNYLEIYKKGITTMYNGYSRKSSKLINKTDELVYCLSEVRRLLVMRKKYFTNSQNLFTTIIFDMGKISLLMEKCDESSRDRILIFEDSRKDFENLFKKIEENFTKLKELI